MSSRWLLSSGSQSCMRSAVVLRVSAVQRRTAIGGGFRSGATTSTPFTVKSGGGGEGAVLGWKPSKRFMDNAIFRYLFENAIAIATYQLVLEGGLTVVFGLLLYTQRCTAEGVVAALERWGYPFTNWISLEDCTYTEGINVGPRTLKPEKLTAAHTAHNIASGLFPVQFAVLVCTYPFVMRAVRAAMAMRAGGAAVKQAVKAAPAGARTSKVAGDAKRVHKSATSPSQPKRRPSYARASTSQRSM